MWDSARKEALNRGASAHVDRVFGICVEKRFELPQGRAGIEFNDRVVFQGNNVQGE